MTAPQASAALPAAEAARIDALAAQQFAEHPPPPPTPSQLALAESVMGPALRRRLAQEARSKRRDAA